MPSLERCAAYWGAHIGDVTKRLLSLVQSTDYYLLLLFHVCTNDTARSSLRSIKKDYGAAVRDSGTQVVFSSILPVKGKGLERASGIWQINKWSQDWCHSQVFGYLDYGKSFEKPSLVGADEVHLTRKGRASSVRGLPGW